MKQFYKLISFKHVICMAIYPKLRSVRSEGYFLGPFVLIHAGLAVVFFSSQHVIKITWKVLVVQKTLLSASPSTFYQ